jgi:hypothetical protein
MNWTVYFRLESTYCHDLGVCEYRRGMNWWMDLLTICIHHSELHFTVHWHTQTSVLSLVQSPLAVSGQRLYRARFFIFPRSGFLVTATHAELLSTDNSTNWVPGKRPFHTNLLVFSSHVHFQLNGTPAELTHQPATSLHFTSLHFTSLHWTELPTTDFSHQPATSLHFTSLHFTSLHFTSLHFTSLHSTELPTTDFSHQPATLLRFTSPNWTADNSYSEVRVRVRVRVIVTLRLAVYRQSFRLGDKLLEIHEQKFYFTTQHVRL